VTVIGSQIQLGWLPFMNAATAEGLDWTSLRDDLTARGLLRPGTVVGVPNWRDAGKIALAMGPGIPVICLNPDCRQFGIADPPERWAGADILLLDPGKGGRSLDGMFERIEELPPSAITLRGRVLKTVSVSMGTRLGRSRVDGGLTGR
jgi:hypothetical protein